jgi:hypothetical protein
LKRLEEICRDVCSDSRPRLKEFNGERDPSKGISSRHLKVEFAASTFWSVRKSGTCRHQAFPGHVGLQLSRLARPAA